MSKDQLRVSVQSTAIVESASGGGNQTIKFDPSLYFHLGGECQLMKTPEWIAWVVVILKLLIELYEQGGFAEKSGGPTLNQLRSALEVLSPNSEPTFKEIV